MKLSLIIYVVVLEPDIEKDVDIYMAEINRTNKINQQGVQETLTHTSDISKRFVFNPPISI